MNDSKIGGKIIGSGGFGCVFNPPLQCASKTKYPVKNVVSKLMMRKYAIDEFSTIKNIKYILNTIDNYTNYFILKDIVLCQPAKVNSKTFNDITKNCSTISKNNKNMKNNKEFNKSLGNYLTLRIPDGGERLETYIINNYNNVNFPNINKKLINLLINGIIPMNERNVYHCDIKDSNILVNKQKENIGFTRLIDWGLSTEYMPFVTRIIPDVWINRPLQFNVPFSIILFTDRFDKMYSDFFKNGGVIEDKIIFKTFIVNYLDIWINERGYGHIAYISIIMKMVYYNSINITVALKNKDVLDKSKDMSKDKDRLDKNVNYNNLDDNYYHVKFRIVQHIYEILIYYTKDNKFETTRYIDEVFSKNVDIWGFITSYLPIIEILYENYDKLSLIDIKIYTQITEMFFKYLYIPSQIKPIDTKGLIIELKNLQELLNERVGNESVISKPLSTTFNRTKRPKSYNMHKFYSRNNVKDSTITEIKSKSISKSKIKSKNKSKSKSKSKSKNKNKSKTRKIKQ